MNNQPSANDGQVTADPTAELGTFYGVSEEEALPAKPERPFKNDYALYNTPREGFLKAMKECTGATESTKNSIYYRLELLKKEQEQMGLSNETIHSMRKKTLEELTAVVLKRKGLYDRKEFAERVKARVNGDEIILIKPVLKSLVMDKGVGWVLFDTLTKLPRDHRAVLWFLIKKLLDREKAEKNTEPIYFTPAEFQNVLGKKSYLAWQIREALDELGKITIPYIYCYSDKHWERIEVGTREQIIQPYWEERGQAVARNDVPEGHRSKWLFGAKFGELFRLVVIYNLLQKRYRLIPVEAFKLKDRAEIVLEYFLLKEASEHKSKLVKIDYETFWKVIFMIPEPKNANNFIGEIRKTLNTLEKRMKVYWGKKGRGTNTKFYLSKSEESLAFCRPRNTKASADKPCLPKTSRELLAEKVSKFRLLTEK